MILNRIVDDLVGDLVVTRDEQQLLDDRDDNSLQEMKDNSLQEMKDNS